MEALLSFLVWLVFGAVVGYVASERRGYSMAAGILGGAFLGLFSPLMFVLSGLTRSDKRRKCPSCAEWVRTDATVCKHCQSVVPPLLPVFHSDATEDERTIVRRMIVQIVVGTAVISTVVLIALNLLVR